VRSTLEDFHSMEGSGALLQERIEMFTEEDKAEECSHDDQDRRYREGNTFRRHLSGMRRLWCSAKRSPVRSNNHKRVRQEDREHGNDGLLRHREYQEATENEATDAYTHAEQPVPPDLRRGCAPAWGERFRDCIKGSLAGSQEGREVQHQMGSQR
jgi:hypothetical protein